MNLSRRWFLKGAGALAIVAAAPTLVKADLPMYTIFDVTSYGAIGNGVFNNSTALANAMTAIKANGGGTLYFPQAQAGGFWSIASALDIRATSNLIIDGVPGTTIKGTAAFNGSDNNAFSSIVSGLNFTGTAAPDGYLYQNITVTSNIIVDGSLQSVGGVPPGAQGGYNMCAVEIMNVDNVMLLNAVIGCYGNGNVVSTHDPRLLSPSITSYQLNSAGTGYVVGDIIKLGGGTVFTGSEAQFQVLTLTGSGIATLKLINRGVYITLPVGNVATSAFTGVGTGATMQVTNQMVANGCKNPVISGPITNTVRGLLPSYASGTEPLGIAGSGMQIGAATNIRVNITGTNVGGPLVDCFNCYGGSIHAVCVSVSATPIGSVQSRGCLHSDFGLWHVTLTGVIPAIELRGAMLSGTGFFFNGGVPTCGPVGCHFNIEVNGALGQVDAYTPGLKLMGGSIIGTVGIARNNSGYIKISNPNTNHCELHDCQYNNLIIDAVNGSGTCIAMFAQIDQAGSGCFNNSLNLTSSGASIQHNITNDATGRFGGQQIKLNAVAAGTISSLNLTANSYLLQ